jgi:hypothetical protein
VSVARTVSGLGRNLRGGLAVNAVAQAVSSLSNVVVALLVAQRVSSHAFGAFAVMVTTYTVAVGLARAFLGEPLLALGSAGNAAGLRGLVGAALGVGVLAGVAVGLGSLLAGGDVQRRMLVLLAVALPLLVLQDCLRYLHFSARNPLRALGLDVVWLFGAVATVSALGHDADVAEYALVWLGAGAFSGLVGWVLVGAPLPGQVRRTLHALSGLGRRYAVEFATAGLVAALPVYAIAVGASTAEAGGFRAATTLLGPANVAFAAVATYYVPLVHRQGLTPQDVLAGARRMALTVGTAVAMWATLLWTMPEAWLRALVGDSAAGARECLPALGFGATLLAVAGGAVVGHRALRAAPTSMRLRLQMAPLGLALPFVGVAVYGLTGVLWSVVAFALVSVVAWWASLARLARRPVPDGAA